MSSGPEYPYVEQPLVDQLVSMGWKAATGNLNYPFAAHRESFSEVLLFEDLRDAVLRINSDDEGNSWLDDSRLNQAISAMASLDCQDLMEANRVATRLLLKGTTVEGFPGADGGRGQTVHYIDWDYPENNTFRVISQLRVDEPGGRPGAYIVPDLVLFVNGIPLAVVECMRPGTVDPIGEAIDRLQRHSNQRAWMDEDEGNERLFHYNQIMVATCFDKAVFGTVGARAVDYMEWKDTSPVPMDYVAANLGKDRLSSQEMLVAGMFRPELLLEIVRHFVFFREEEDRVIKIVPRYQQFRAVRHAVHRLLDGKTRDEDGEFDGRGGIIWHTQGSGKSLTLAFLARKIRSHPELGRFKVVAVTNQKDLEPHFLETAELTGSLVEICGDAEHLKRALAKKEPGLICAMTLGSGQAQEDFDGDEGSGVEEQLLTIEGEEYPVMNTDDSILLLVDEAHPSDATSLQTTLMAALPNCAKIGFTGTPIAMEARNRAHEIFGPFIDRYAVRESENDGSTVPVLYEGRTAEGAVSEGWDDEDVFEDMSREHTQEELEAIQRRYATSGRVGEAPQLIAAKVRSMLRHYVDNVLPNRFKAQVVAVSRRATIRYHRAFQEARDELVAELEALDPSLCNIVPGEINILPPHTRFLIRAHPNLEIIRELESAPVISGDPDDPPAWASWTTPAHFEAHIARFQKPLRHEDPKKRDGLAFLFVKSMLLTEFNAPLEGVLYLDRHLNGRPLLQAIARVNRPYPRKQAGLVVDYHGTAQHLEEVLGDYADEDVGCTLRTLRDESPRLRNRHLRILALFAGRGLQGITDSDACVDLLKDGWLRAEFQVLLRRFLESLEIVLPREEALPYLEDAKNLGVIQARARNRYRDEKALIGQEVGEKVRRLVDDHLLSVGIDPDLPPISIMDPVFEEQVENEKSDRAKALEMEHAVRSHLQLQGQEDQEYFLELREHLEDILIELEDQWSELVVELRAFVKEVKAGPPKDDAELDPATEIPFLRILRQALRRQGEVSREQMEALAPITLELVDHIRQEVRNLDFWRNSQKQEALRERIINMLSGFGVFQLDRVPEVVDRVMELARANPPRLVA